MIEPRVTMVEEAGGLEPIADALARARRVAVDTESNSLYVYQEQVCYVQLGVGSEVYLIDTIAIDDLGPLVPHFERPDLVKILHGADYDVACLGRDFGFRFKGLFDTMIAAQLLGHEQLGLAALVERYCGIELDKSHTRHNWGARPTEERFIPYLVDDVRYLERVHDAVVDEVHDADIEEECDIEFRRVENQPWARTEKDPETFRRIKGAGKLRQGELAVLREAWNLRESAARKMNRPPFKVLGNNVLMAVAIRQPRSMRDLRGIQGLSPMLVDRFGKGLLAAVQEGLKKRADVPLRNPNRKPRMPREQAAVVDGLKEWRRRTVEREGRLPVLVLPNHVLEALAEARPDSLDALAAHEGLGRKRFDRYGEAILDVIRNPPSPDRWMKKRRER